LKTSTAKTEGRNRPLSDPGQIPTPFSQRLDKHLPPATRRSKTACIKHGAAISHIATFLKTAASRAKRTALAATRRFTVNWDGIGGDAEVYGK
jgi:hypothetical protein